MSLSSMWQLLLLLVPHLTAHAVESGAFLRANVRRHHAQRGSSLLAAGDSAAQLANSSVRGAATDLCSSGVRSGDGVCCAASCGRCGGSGCASLSGGAAACCRGTIRSSGRECQVAGDTGCLLPQEGICIDLVGQYSCSNTQQASTSTLGNVGACHKKCRESAGCTGGEFHKSSQQSTSGQCHLYGVAGAATQCLSAVKSTSVEAVVFSCEQPGLIGFSFKVTNVKYDQMVASSTLRTSFVAKLAEAIAVEGGNGLTSSSPALILSTDVQGDVVVQVTVTPATSASTRAVETALSNAATLQPRLASAVAAVPNIGTITTGTFAVSDLTAPSISIPIDLSSVIARFGSLQQQIDELSAQLGSVNDVIDSLSANAASTNKTVMDAVAGLDVEVQKANQNQELAASLNLAATNASSRIYNALQEVQRVQGVLNRMEGSALTMDGQTQNLTTRLDSLKLQAALLLPGGKGGLLERLKSDETTLQKYQSDAKDTATVEVNATATLRENFRRATVMVENLTAELQANLTSKAADSDEGSPQSAS
eukprot:CAMPEP_0178437576 /NCGR_PEP_ID=MMETSP0689_2-20121128/35083_1 /TAXON_ID=160604 /ORGANISM="Amphidinium massartii, Strain CS-259" /LENGTH=537 /DNA_ID=CAMNT_0020059821 /DNA_START=42 /DNA_END=1651 /DNA_ORIENTATION=-